MSHLAVLWWNQEYEYDCGSGLESSAHLMLCLSKLQIMGFFEYWGVKIPYIVFDSLQTCSHRKANIDYF